MNIKSIAKASKLYEEIKQIEKDIHDIHLHAQVIAQGEEELNMTIAFDHISKRKNEKKKILDSDGSLIGEGYGLSSISFFYHPGMNVMKEEDKNKSKIELKVTDKVALTILGMMIQEKEELKRQLISKIERIK